MNTEQATCRGCGMVLKGKAFHLGGTAYHPRTNERCPTNHYGGYVCSETCDVRASVEQLRDMPGCSGASRPSTYAAESIRRNWGTA